MVDATLAAVSKYCEINVYATFQGRNFIARHFKSLLGFFVVFLHFTSKCCTVHHHF